MEAVERGEWSPQPRVTQSHSIFNSNKKYIHILPLAHERARREEEEEEEEGGGGGGGGVL